MKKVLLVLLVLVFALSGILAGCSCQKEKKEGETSAIEEKGTPTTEKEGSSVIAVVKRDSGEKIKVIYTGPPELECKWEEIGMYDAYEMRVFGSMTNRCDRPVKFDQIAFLSDNKQVSFSFGLTLWPGETIKISAKRYPSPGVKTFEIRVVGFRKL